MHPVFYPEPEPRPWLWLFISAGFGIVAVSLCATISGHFLRFGGLLVALTFGLSILGLFLSLGVQFKHIAHRWIHLTWIAPLLLLSGNLFTMALVFIDAAESPRFRTLSLAEWFYLWKFEAVYPGSLLGCVALFTWILLPRRAPSDHLHCTHCGFNLRGSYRSPVCPECGSKLIHGDDLPVYPEMEDHALTALNAPQCTDDKPDDDDV